MRFWRARRHASARGQAVVEFGLVLPLFLLLLIAIIEFAFAFSTLNSLNFVARDVALVTAEGGNRLGTDCTALNVLEREFGATSDRAGIATVEIYWSDQNGNVLGSQVNRFNRSGSLICSDLDGVSRTLPYTAAGATYPEAIRCNVLAGCGGSHTVLDTIGVKVTYAYSWKTPLSVMLGFLGPATFTATQQMRMEPVL
jgi:Flp pilus assembly protein TadG